MRKLYIFLIVAALCAIGVSAKTLYIWRNGVKTDLQIQTNDSITFNEGNTPTMHIWSNGTEIYQQALAVDDSITYAKDSMPVTTGFDYDHWREQTTIAIYHSQNKFDTIALPWAPVAATSIPMEYKHPELDTLPDGTYKWQLAFNICDSTTIPGVDMFGLWDEDGQLMRVYAYLEQLPNPSATSCYYEVKSSAPAFLSADSKGFMPTNSTISNCNWSKTMPGRMPQPTPTYCELLPITGTLNGQVNPGWICFELSFASGLFSVSPQATITFSLIGLEQIDFTGEAIISGLMTSQGGKITIPGNKAKQTGGIMSAVGDGVAKICDFVMGGLKLDSPAGWVSAGIGIAGTAVSATGNAISAAEEGKDKTYTLDLNFHVADTAQINGSLSSRLPTTIYPVQLTYERFLEQILKHSKKQSAGKEGAKKAYADNGIDLGIWNLENPPIVYVATDAAYIDRDGATALISFLDPGSIKLALNEQLLEDQNNPIMGVSIIAYDFVFTSPNYTMPNAPYRNFYDIPSDLSSLTFPFYWTLSNNDPFQFIFYSDGWSESEGWQRFSNGYYMNFEDQSFALTDTAHCNKIYDVDRGGIKYNYFGVSTPDNGAATLAGCPIVCSPLISTMLYDKDVTIDLTQIYVSVALELTYLNGDKRFFADRFLPQIKGFTRAEAQSIYDQINYEWHGYCSPVQNTDVPLFDLQKDKAKRLLEPLMYYIGFQH